MMYLSFYFWSENPKIQSITTDTLVSLRDSKAAFLKKKKSNEYSVPY